MKIKMILSAALFVVSAVVFAQKPGIKFNETTHDFGTVAQENGDVTHVFEFTNTGNADLVLSNVQSSCGCTTPSWSREPIAPGQKGSITVKYGAASRPGKIDKSITVTSNADRQTLYIKGSVTPRGQKIEDIYPVLVDDSIRLKTTIINFHDVVKGESRTEKLPIANISNKEQVISFTGLPSYVTVEPLTLKPGEKSSITFVFNSEGMKEWGSIKKDIQLKNNAQTVFTINAFVSEKFTDEQRANAPVIETEPKVDMGSIVLGKKKTVELTVKNTGKSPLYIRSVGNGNDEISVKAPAAIKAGKTGKVKITVDASKLTNAQAFSKFITLQLNDPNAARKNIIVSYTTEAAAAK
ncbi:MAG: DUF1573 domain-containing protein [Prevotellaceae bacterium]|jgi:hypothetical protein|nr:DUF1573 domain-containing protein [Prevotellaceae bacterium]